MTQRNISATSSHAVHRVPHRVTVRKTAYQVQRLQEVWAVTHTPTKEQREQLADEIGLETRIVSTWFRDERSKITRANAERARIERATVGPIRNTRTANHSNSAGRFRSADVEEEDDEDDEEQPKTRAQSQTRYQPYRTIEHVTTSTKKPNQQLQHQQDSHFDPLIRGSVPIDPRPAYSDRHEDHEQDSYGCVSPAAYARRSLPAPSISSSETTEEDEDEDEDDELDNTAHHRRQSTPRTPGLMPSTIPSPRVIQPSSSPNDDHPSLPPISSFVTNPDLASPRMQDVFLHPSSGKAPGYGHAYGFPAKSPYNTPLTLPTQSGGTYTFQPLPVIVGNLPKRDANWRFGYYDRVSSIRHTLAGDRRDRDRHFDHSDIREVGRGEEDVHMEESDEDEDSGSEHAHSTLNSPTFRSVGKKQLFVETV